jgi:hypothetical protein
LDNDEFADLPSNLKYPDIARGMGANYLNRLSKEQQQKIIDYFSSELKQLLGLQNEALNERMDVHLYKNIVLKYPKFLLEMNGKTIIGKGCCHICPKMNSDALRKNFLKGSFWPMVLIEKMQAFANLN